MSVGTDWQKQQRVASSIDIPWHIVMLGIALKRCDVNHGRRHRSTDKRCRGSGGMGPIAWSRESIGSTAINHCGFTLDGHLPGIIINRSSSSSWYWLGPCNRLHTAAAKSVGRRVGIHWLCLPHLSPLRLGLESDVRHSSSKRSDVWGKSISQSFSDTSFRFLWDSNHQTQELL